MLVKFHLSNGSEISLIARNNRGHETNEVADAIKLFQRYFGENTVFMLDEEYQSKRKISASAPLSEAREQEIREAFPNLFAAV